MSAREGMANLEVRYDDEWDNLPVTIRQKGPLKLGKLKQIVAALDFDARDDAYHFTEERDVVYCIHGSGNTSKTSEESK
jgi:hypothetical protein